MERDFPPHSTHFQDRAGHDQLTTAIGRGSPALISFSINTEPGERQPPRIASFQSFRRLFFQMSKNPYTPDADPNTLFLERTFLAGDYLAGVGYGKKFMKYCSY
jgi:hypothetical protein